jgi:hypothetical protein
VLGGGKTNNIKLTMKEGGTVTWQFRVQFSKPDPVAIAALSGLLQQVVPVTLECRSEDDEGSTDLFDQVEKQTQQPMSDARRLAEQEFGKTSATVDTLPATLATPAGDPDFQEVKGAGQPDDVVDATFTPGEGGAEPVADPIPLKTDEAPAASNVEPIAKGRRGGAKRSASGGNLE